MSNKQIDTRTYEEIIKLKIIVILYLQF